MDDQEADVQQKENDEAQATLIATLFAKSRPSLSASKDPPESTPTYLTFEPTLSDPFTTLLKPLVSPAPLCLFSSISLSPHVLQLTYSTTSLTLPPSHFRHHPTITNFETANGLELVLDIFPSSPAHPSRRPLKLVVFDMDSTLIDQEVIDELARTINITPAVSAITARAMNGEIDFAESLRERVALLKGVKADVWEDLKGIITIAAGAKELIAALRNLGVKTAVVSGGFAPMAEWLKGELGLDYAFANHLLSSPPTPQYPYPHLSGLLSSQHPLIDASQKKLILRSLASEHSVPLSQTLAVGDGANDLLMMEAAGLGLAWRAKEKVQKRAPQRLNGEGMGDLLFLLGMRVVEVEGLVEEAGTGMGESI